MSEPRRSITPILFPVTVFLSAFLLFQVQPLISHFILPWFGGSPAVWTTCMLFFQATLFGGYLYAHVVVEQLKAKPQLVVHAVLLLAAFLLLPIVPDSEWKPVDGSEPIGRILKLLAVTVGMPFLMLATTGPLLQAWFVRAEPDRSPWRLYALSNAGSLLGLLSYPFVVEPLLTTHQQAVAWSWAFRIFVVLCAVCGWIARPRDISNAKADSTEKAKDKSPSKKKANSAKKTGENSEGLPTAGQGLLWLSLAATGTTMLLATTNQLCADVSVVPFLWVLPLSLYLVSFIVCFDSDRWYTRKVFGIGLFVLAPLVCLLLWDVVLGPTIFTSLAVPAAILLATMFCACMVCHGELARLKPKPDHLTMFYLSISAGGAMGGVFVSIVAPMLFLTLFELPFGLLAALLLLLLTMRGDGNSILAGGARRPLTAVMSVAILILSVLFYQQADRTVAQAVGVSRNFYGMLRVDIMNSAFAMKHGEVWHGIQFRDEARRLYPTTYYGRASGAGVVLAQHNAGQPRRVGLIGLGAGTLAVYANPDDTFRFYEINPDVISMADEFFTFLKSSEGDVQIEEGDARIRLEREDPQQFDVLVLDAFSGDAVPAHLLTKECGAVYLKHINDDGILAVHITNRHLDLRRVCEGLAEEFELSRMLTHSPSNEALGTNESLWFLMSRERSSLQALTFTDSTHFIDIGQEPVLWTDSWSNLLSVLAIGSTRNSMDAVPREQAIR